MSKKHFVSNNLFARTNFLIGAGSIFNLAGNYFEFNSFQSGEVADARAIESDWAVVGIDLKETFKLNPKESIQLEK